MSAVPPIAWTIAGSDSGGGAGIQADLKVFQGYGVHGCSCITALTAQNTRQVTRIEPASPGLVEAQLLALQQDLPPAAIKIGMLGSAAAINIVAEFLHSTQAYVVCDPVMLATQGGRLLPLDALQVFRERLLPRVDVLTPNLEEAGHLLGLVMDTDLEIVQGARDLMTLGPKAILIKGGHGRGDCSADYWWDGQTGCWLNLPRLPTPHTHGGGCTLSSAIAAGRAQGLPPLDAAVLAKAYTHRGLRLARLVGQGRNPLAHAGWPDSPDDMPWLSGARDPTPRRITFPVLGKIEFGLYPIVDRADWVERLLDLGVNLVQLRAKDLQGVELEAEVQRAIAAGRQARARVFINDAWELALKHGAYGVHLGQDDLPGADLAALARAGLRLGISTHGYAEVARALSVLPSYIAIGTLYESPSKNFAHQPLGLENFTRLRKLVQVPVVAIGGITRDRAPAVRAAGADSIAVISDITRAPDLAGRVAEWRRVLSRPTGSG